LLLGLGTLAKRDIVSLEKGGVIKLGLIGE
jgi:hypothetical protein